MSDVRDLYSILGVPHGASEEEIKKAYRRLAREHHPDVSGDPESDDRFKEVAAAYEILSDPAKRRQYDMYGSRGGPDAFPFGDVGDIFEAFFGGGGFGRRRTQQRRTRTARGDDLFATVGLSFTEAAFGAYREIVLERLETCGKCSGSGAEPGTSPSRCRECHGTGHVQDVRRSIFGTMMTAHLCAACEGTGEEILRRCADCRGAGRIALERKVPVDVPPGVSDGLELRVTGVGNAGRAGGSPGDLYLSIRVAGSDVFERRGQDLFATLDVSMVQAALGAELEVETIDGAERIKLDPGTDSGTVIRLRGEGIPNLGRRGRGDLFLTVHVETPKDLRKDERAVLEQLAKLRGDGEKKARVARARLRGSNRDAS